MPTPRNKIRNLTARGAIMAVSLSLAATLALPACADTPDQSRQLISLGDGESRTINGVAFVAHGATLAIGVLSSEFTSVAVLEGELATSNPQVRPAGPGQVIVTGLDTGQSQRLHFDAERLRATLRPEWADRAAPALAQIARRQRGQRFWGRLAPSGVNAASPASSEESARAAWLADPIVVELRRAAAGRTDQLAQITVERFVAAVAAGDRETVASLLDPLPFTLATTGNDQWQANRRAFATAILRDTALTSTLAQGQTPPEPQGDGWVIAGNDQSYRIALAMRERAFFIAAVEPQL